MTDGDDAGHKGGVALASTARTPPPTIESTEPAAGSTPSFEMVYDDHFDFVWRCARRLGVPDRHMDDAVQDVFIVVHRKLAAFEGRASLKTWLFSIARRVASDHRRRVQRKEHVGELPGAIADPRGATPLRAAQQAEAVRTLHDLLATLPDEQREVFVLAELEQMSAPEIAGAVGAKVNTVYSRLRLARSAFNRAVARHAARDGSRARRTTDD